jgi:hypothetical protein
VSGGKKHRFDWHAEEKGGGSFLSWAVLTMVSGAREDDLFDELAEKTGSWKDVELGITLNGVEISAEKFMKRLDQAIDSAVEHEAAKIVAGIDRLRELDDLVARFTAAVKEEAAKAALAAGIRIEEEGW